MTEAVSQLELIRHLAEYTTEKNWADKRDYILQAANRALSAALAHPGQVREIAIKPTQSEPSDFSPGIDARIFSDPCVQKLQPGEPFFVLLGRDVHASQALSTWISYRLRTEGRTAKVLAAEKTLDAFRDHQDALALPLPVQESGEKSERLQVGWAYNDIRWDGDRWHVCGLNSKPRSVEGRRVEPVYLSPSPSIPEEKGTAESVDRLRAIETAAMAYVESVHGEPEKDCWDTEDGKEAPGANRFASDWSWKAYDDKKQKAFEDLCATLSTASEGSTDE
jgi:hypothetical protein